MSIAIEVARDDQSIRRTAGEAQSTVVPPKVKSESAGGRFLATVDLLRPPSKGLVVGRDLNTAGTQVLEAVFDPVPNSGMYVFGTNDHDLVSLSNGDVLYITGAFSRMPLTPKPAWFDVTYRGGFGPGARTVVLAWRSTDTGQRFTFASEMDPARIGDGSAASPQFPRKTDAPGSPSRPVFDMGGTDGQLVFVDPWTGTIYLTHQCVGYHRDTTVSDHFELSQTPVNRTLVFASEDRGASWKHLGEFPLRGWRLGGVPLTADRLCFGASNMLFFARRHASGSWTFDSTGKPTTSAWGWDQSFYTDPAITSARRFIHANMYAHTLVIGSYWKDTVVLAYPSTIGGRHGYRLFFYNLATGRFTESKPIVPASPSAWIMHLTAIQLGTTKTTRGHALLYWYEMNAGGKPVGIVNGRVIVDGGETSGDVPLSRAGGAPRSFDLNQGTTPYWYGDYHTADGYSQPVLPSDIQTHQYFPMWVEPDGTLRYTKVQIRLGLPVSPAATVSAASEEDRGVEPAAVELATFAPSPREREEVWEYSRRSREREG